MIDLSETEPVLEPVTDTWETPDHILDLARDVLGTITLDPATSDRANLRVRAERYFTIADDGLGQSWGWCEEGGTRVWLNCPYSKRNGVSQAGLFAAKLLEEHRAGRVAQGIILVNVCTDTAWWHETMWRMHLCFVRGRLRFLRADRGNDSPRYASALGYVGHRPYRFADVFSRIGHIVPPTGGVP